MFYIVLIFIFWVRLIIIGGDNMIKFEDAKKIGLRAKGTNKIIAIYPDELKGTNKEIEKTVRDWYYQQSCGAEDDLLSAFVDVLTDEEIKSRNL